MTAAARHTSGLSKGSSLLHFCPHPRPASGLLSGSWQRDPHCTVSSLESGVPAVVSGSHTGRRHRENKQKSHPAAAAISETCASAPPHPPAATRERRQAGWLLPAAKNLGP